LKANQERIEAKEDTAMIAGQAVMEPYQEKVEANQEKMEAMIKTDQNK
jgi:hypothetical protein